MQLIVERSESRTPVAMVHFTATLRLLYLAYSFCASASHFSSALFMNRVLRLYPPQLMNSKVAYIAAHLQVKIILVVKV